MKKTGVCKWFDAVKGYGFIVPDDGSQDIFVYYRDVGGDRPLETGQPVAFDVISGRKGLQATNVVVEGA